jgi:hypothetical protein
VRARPVLMVLALLARASSGHGEENGLPLDLTWTAPEGCATADQIRAELGRIARVRPGRTVARVSAQGRIDKTGDSLRLTLRTEQGGTAGERTLLAKECRSLEREVTLVLAVAFGEGVEIVDTASGAAGASESESAAGAGSQSEPSATPLPPKPPPAVAPVAAPAPKGAADAPSSSRRSSSLRAGDSATFHASAFAGGGVEFRVLPSPAAFVVLGGDFGTRRFWLEPRAIWLPHVTGTSSHGIGARYDGFGGALSGCAALPPFAWAVSACIGGEATALRGRSTGASENDEAFAPLVGAAALVSWQWPSRGGVGLRLEAALHVAFNEPRFVVQGLGDVHQVPRLAPGLAATVVLFP